MYEYRARVTAVVDADTIDTVVDLGLYVSVRARLRVLGIDAPERWSPAGRTAVAWARLELPVGAAVIVATHKDGTEKYGRWLARVVMADGRDYAAAAVAAGYALAWDGQGQKPTP
jgi:micrococcal nuclease